MINREIFTESPEEDLWRELLQYSYRANVSRYLKEHSLDEDENTINTIIGSFLQANEYFKASKSANLQISPLLLYYGATNLLLGLPESIKPLEKCLVTKFEKIEEILLAETLIIFSLQKSLENACSLLYTALIGDDLCVFNNDNIFNIDKNYSNSLRKVIQLSAVGIFLNGKSNMVGDIMLVDCDPYPKHHMHEFGVIQSYSASFNGEMGNTSKVTMMVVDDLLNPYYLLTNRIIDMDFPPLVREEVEDSKDKNISVKKKISRNEKCPCGSGLKYKFCCGKNK